MGCIVVGYVPKAEGRAALHRAAKEARLRSVRLVVVSSRRGRPESDPGDASETAAELPEIRQQLEDAGVEHEIRQVARGTDPAEELITVAGDVGAEFIVIGLRRRTPIGKLILGRNAQRVLLEAPCPVLAVKAAE